MVATIIIDEVDEEKKWDVTLYYDGGGRVEKLPLSVDIDQYAFAVLHTIEMFEMSRRKIIKWNEKEIEYRNRNLNCDFNYIPK